MPNSASTVPPFIPGLLIVSLLIIISILIGWRNYSRRGNPRLMPGMSDWAFWEVEPGGETSTSRPERPKMWEVGVGGNSESEKNGGDGNGWERIMPLSVTSVTPEPPPFAASSGPEVPRNSTTTNPSRLSRLSFLSSSPAPSPAPPSPLPTTADRLQVSVLISMPSPRQSLSLSPPAPPESPSENPPRASTSSSLWKERPEVDHAAEEEGAPEVALGVALLPWRKNEDVERGQTSISVT